ncbi:MULTISPECIES: radical SAM protein [unclassified Streptomyces]|uniref:radical SAM protein n=1 Tax=unclassified Streptomyces TaxID=2593676 RepID=UPI001BEA8CE5|nr:MULTISPECIES: radical SAM protein [unclassified Streptomyces]MBT2404951.1 radical SAM protein [Streptomyces sp. ISL-21]MBT2459373.1 radical SAM protein [Streptomyces sp. ISL-86]MBT2610677.1 radical SAM protein [Streptomyces sp. ISL-87]
MRGLETEGPVTLACAYLDAEESTDLLAGTPTPTHAALAALCFTPGGTAPDLREALLHRLHTLRIDPAPRRVSGLRIVLTDRCNIACDYCFVQTNTGKADMTEEELTAGLTYLSNAGHEEVSIQWFGGEPTIRFDLMQFGDALADTLARQHGVQRIRRTVVTNGARLTDDMLRHFLAHDYGIGISIDGPPAINSANRKLLGGQPADDRIRSNIQRLLEHEGLHVGCNLTPTSANIGRLGETVAWIIDELGLKFIYANTPIPSAGKWKVDGSELARELYEARMVALGRGGMLFSVLDRAFQALDTRRPMLYDHMQGDQSINAALLTGNRVSVCDINFDSDAFLYTLDQLRADPSLLAGAAKTVAPIPACGTCPALAICGGPSRNEQLLIGGNTPDPHMCDFYTGTVEIAVWDNTGVQ